MSEVDTQKAHDYVEEELGKTAATASMEGRKRVDVCKRPSNKHLSRNGTDSMKRSAFFTGCKVRKHSKVTYRRKH